MKSVDVCEKDQRILRTRFINGRREAATTSRLCYADFRDCARGLTASETGRLEGTAFWELSVARWHW